MAKLTGEAGIGGRRDQALGPAYRISMWRGIPRVYAVGFRKKKKISPKQRQAMENFRHLANLAKYITLEDYEAALTLSKGSQYLWRDLIYMTYSGRLFNFQTPDGKRWYSMAARTTASDMLDMISQEPGSILYRGEDWWEYLPPGQDGDVLTMTAGGVPVWGAGGGSGGAFSWVHETGSNPPEATATKGGAYELPHDLVIRALQMRVAAPPDGTLIRGTIWTWTDPTIGTLLGETPDIEYIAGQTARPFAFLHAPALIPANTPFAVLWTARNTSTTFNLGNSYNSPLNASLIFKWDPQRLSQATNNPTAGMTIGKVAQRPNFGGIGLIP